MQSFDRLKVIRKHLKLSQIEFANSLGIKQGSYSDIERGRTGNISSYLLKIIESNYNINIDWLLTGEGSMLKSTASDVVPEYGIDYKEKYYDALEEIREIRRELDSVKNILLHAKEDTPSVQGSVRGASTG